MNANTAKHRARTLSLALAAFLAWPWLGSAAISLDDDPLGGVTTRVGISRIGPANETPAKDPNAIAAAGIVVTDDDSEGPPEFASSLYHAWSYFGAIWGSASDGLGAIHEPGRVRSLPAPRRLRC